MPRVCIDAGHYGSYNPSPAVDGYIEAQAMWRLQDYLCRELEALGVQTVKTRSLQSEDLPLTERGKKAQGCDLLVSLHSNAAGDGVREDIDYPVAYVSISGAADSIGLRLAQCVEQMMNTAQSARIEHREGSRGDYYGVLRGAAEVNVPGVILEHSFHTNTRAASWLMDEGNLARLAAAEGQIIAQYLGVPDRLRRYRYLTDIPESDGFRSIIAELMESGILKGDGKNPPMIDLSHDMLRLLVILHRAGVLQPDTQNQNNKENRN